MLLLSGCSIPESKMGNTKENQNLDEKGHQPIQSEQTQNQQKPQSSLSQQPEISTDELAKHSSLTDCWVVYKGEVFDITEFIPKHPGGKSVFSSLCGSPDKFEVAFVGQHGFSKVDILVLEAKLIGKLAQ